jgi:lysozyme
MQFKSARLKKTGMAGLVAAIGAIGAYEGLELKAYRDIVGVVTACYGETKGIRMGMAFTKPECDTMLARRLDEFTYEIEKCVPAIRDPDKVPLLRYGAYLSLAYNIGHGGFCKSSIARHANAGMWTKSCDAIGLYNKAGGKVIRGLVLRRSAEQKDCRRGG